MSNNDKKYTNECTFDRCPIMYWLRKAHGDVYREDTFNTFANKCPCHYLGILSLMTMKYDRCTALLRHRLVLDNRNGASYKKD